MTTIHTIDVLIWIGVTVFVTVALVSIIRDHIEIRRHPEKYGRKTGTPSHGQDVHGGYELNPLIHSPSNSSLSGNIHHR